MHESSSTSVGSRERVPLSGLGPCRERWATLRLSTARADREAAERGVGLAYRAAGFEPPERVEWCDGPLEIGQKWGRARLTRAAGIGIRDAISSNVVRRAMRATQDRVNALDWIDAVDGMRLQALDATSLEIHRVMRIAVERSHQSIWTYIVSSAEMLAGGRNLLKEWPSLERCMFAPAALEWLGLCQFLREAAGLERETECLEGLWLLAAHAGWVLPHERVCWVCERPTVVARDASGRLHCANGPALAFVDGWSAYYWKGIQVQPDLVKQPETITLESIDQQRDIFVRRCMIDILTPKRFIELGGARKIHEDEAGILWRRSWFAGDSWAAVEVVNATPEPDGTFRRYILQVPPDLQSARAAVAWTYGMSDWEYGRLSLRT